MYLRNRAEYDAKAKEWTSTYANEESSDGPVQRVAEMGFNRADALRALEENGWNEEQAVNSLLGM